jgi:hypothetical protein
VPPPELFPELACLLAEMFSTQRHSYIISQGISTQDCSKPAAIVQNSTLSLSLSLSLSLFSSTKYKTKTSSSLQKQMPVIIPFLLQIHGHKSSIYNLIQIKTSSSRQKEQTPIPPALPNSKSISHKSSI